jgi:hypothetical protein
MVDATAAIEVASLLLSLTLIFLTWVLLPDNPWFAITARRHWIRSLNRWSEHFREYHHHLDARSLGRLRSGLKWLDIATRVPIVVATVLLTVGSVFDGVPIWAWDYAVPAIFGWMLISRIVVDLLSTNRQRLADFAEKDNPATWSPRDLRLAAGLTLASRHKEYSELLAVGSALGVFFSFIQDPYNIGQQNYGVVYLGEILTVGIYWTWYLLESERRIESRIYRAFVGHRPGFKVVVDIFYGGNGRVVENGEIYEIGEQLRVRDRHGGWFELRWKRIDLLVAHDQPRQGPDTWSGVA